MEISLGKATRRGIKKCIKCGVYNGTKSMVCKNKKCDMIFKDSSEKRKSISDAVQLITPNIRKLYSVRITEHGLDNRGFVQLPSTHSLNVNGNNSQFNDVALCFVDNCPRLLQNSFSSISCQHISASVKSHIMATPLPVELNSIMKLKTSKEVKEKLWILANEKNIPSVQKVSKNVMAVRCQVTPKHPLGYLHFTITQDSSNEHGTYFCDCSGTVRKTVDLPTTSSLRSVKSDIDEKYPENLSKESLIDLNNVVNLPPVPEDIFTCFTGKPTRSASLSSLKSIRKVKLFLQKAESSEDDDNSSENEDHDFSKLFYGDNEELVKNSQCYSPTKKLLLGNIKEETHD